MSSSPPLVLVYLGEFPTYGTRAVQLAVEMSGVPVVLVTDGEVPAALRRWAVRTGDFYDEVPFGQASRAIDQDAGFRDGFWFRTLERLFVLEQYQRRAGLDMLFHAELDNLVFRLDRFHSSVGPRLPDDTITLPFWSADLALASLVHVRGASPLADLIEFASADVRYGSEMHMLAAFGRKHPGRVVQAPSLECLLPDLPFRSQPVAVGGGVDTGEGWMFDASSMGQWIVGQEALNDRSVLVCNHFVNEAIEASALRPRLRLDDDDMLQVVIGDESVVAHNLHLHHKVHAKLRSRRHLQALFLAARLPMRMPLAVNWQLGPRAARRVGRRLRRVGRR